MLYRLTIFIGAFLLFQVQPLIAKLVLPLFGGGAAIWTACLLFFQGFLLCGYLYAHCLTKLGKVRNQVGIHLFLLCLSMFFLPMSLADFKHTAYSSSPLGDIVVLLAVSIGLPYLLLSSTGPLLQRWLSYENGAKAPYKLYSLSNIGSLLALISYPFLLEPTLTLTAQATFWTVGYLLFTLAISIICIAQFKTNTTVMPGPRAAQNRSSVSTKIQVLLWLILSAVGVVLLVSTTNAMTQNVPPVPFLWVLPLSLYLLTFIVSFHSPRLYVRWYWFALCGISALAAMLMFFIGSVFDIISQVVIYSVILFSACMICHGELARLKPEAERLTLFYLMMSLGGFLGSAFVAFVAQNLFSSFLEFPLAIFAVFLLLGSCIYWQRYSFGRGANEEVPVWLARASFVSVGVVIGIFVYLNDVVGRTDVIASRNFYGILSVKDVEVDGRLERRLIDGTTSHGTQSLQEGFQGTPMSYYRFDTGVALALEHGYSKPNLKVGMVGLGAGTLAAYGKKGDDYRFYELNPQVEALSRSHFTYLDESKANIDVVLGDARVSLSRELEESGSNGYQVLVVDAFSGDAIPAHLLTKEAVELYWRHLDSSGVLAIHISNRHLDLRSLVRGLASSVGKQALYFETPASGNEVNDARWVILTNNQSFIDSPRVKQLVSAWPNLDEEALVWTDDYSNLLSVVK